MFSKIQKSFRIAKNHKKNKKVEKEYRALHSLHKMDFFLQYAMEADSGATDKPSSDGMEDDDEDDDWMAVEHRDPASLFLGSPNAEVLKVDTGFANTIQNTHPAAKVERKEQGIPTTAKSPSLPLSNRAGADKGFSSCLYGTNANVAAMGRSFQPPSAPVSYWAQGMQAAIHLNTLFSLQRAASVARTFMKSAVTAKDIVLQAADVRGEDAEPDSDDDPFVDENGRTSTGPSCTAATRRKSKTSSTRQGMGVNKRHLFPRR